ncbi:hypothetical protein DFH08DRAFT_878467 [Mycena albidolilacea]|uniref:Uncharacterized protein n=1 Tax=Mycena albidolilacea TaxID=1033008 RepID=A0AAD6ZRV4_9AGAR|nr:hypothetical protein DFH08DRAFT_878467 [Mycena albidolilacea]
MTSTANSDFWRAYDTKVKATLGASPNAFTLPPTQAWFELKTAPIEEVVNFLVHNLADTLRTANGSVDTSSNGYAQALSGYLDAVDTDGLVSPGDRTALDGADEERKKANNKFEEVKRKALEAYQQEKDGGVTDSTFKQWIANHNYPQYGIAEGEVNKAQTAYETIYNRTQGKIDTLNKYREKVKNALNTTVLKSGFNMPIQDKDAGFLPAYSAQGLTRDLGQWFKNKGSITAQSFFKSKVADTNSPAGSEDIFLEVTTKGSPGKYDIHPGIWDLPNVKTLYPKLKPGVENPLDPTLVRPFSFLVGFDVELKVTMGGTSQVLASSGENPVVLGILCK